MDGPRSSTPAKARGRSARAIASTRIPGIPHREIACSEDFEVLEIVAPANFKTRIVEAPTEQAQAAE